MTAEKEVDYQEAVQKFLEEEATRRAEFDAYLAQKRRQLDGARSGDARMSKVRLEAELARKTMAIDEELKVKIAEMWKAYDTKVGTMRAAIDGKIEKMIETRGEALRRKIEEIRSRYAEISAQRKIDIEKQMTTIREAIRDVSVDDSLEDRRAFLKIELVDFKRFPSTKLIADEDALKRLGATIHKQSIFSSRECILYRGTCAGRDCAVKIVVLGDRSNQYRANIRESSKVARNLACGGANGEPRHSLFVHIYDVFISDMKTYTFMEELSTVSLDARAKSRKIGEGELKNALRCILDGLEFIHTRAIAHLNLRAESVLFTADGTAKLAGLCYAKIYFNPDTETFFPLPKIDRKREFLPCEVYLQPTFEPRPVDVYSFGFLLYLVLSELFQKTRLRKIGHVDYVNLTARPAAKAFVELTTVRDPARRPKIGDLKQQPYFTASEGSKGEQTKK